MTDFLTYNILSVDKLADTVVRMAISAPDIVRNAHAGQFVVIIVDEKGERIPLTIADFDKGKGDLTVIFQEVGFSTIALGRKRPGELLYAVLGPLGKPTHTEKFGSVLCVGGGVGVAELWPVARALKNAGNRVSCIAGARTKSLIILENELKNICDDLSITTDDGSYGQKGFVTGVLSEKIRDGEYSYVYAIGPVPMMKKVAEITRPYKIKTVVSLNPLMVDATGMCGVCRCKVEGKTVFGCVDGPEFDAHKVDFDELSQRLSFFKDKESQINDPGVS
ncbi:MAG: sulfide/dihydroorotate dehydrogenase-like FAD/NAD-binding protein [Candidatus Omnitrophica bacterium]|nr:sulfide/dihydroorotate dehydrogenase-like FAD/NAD-binding protein [Candidatus Omnitrophota bacterium]